MSHNHLLILTTPLIPLSFTPRSNYISATSHSHHRLLLPLTLPLMAKLLFFEFFILTASYAVLGFFFG